MRGRESSPAIDSHQGIFAKGHIELEVHGVVDKDLGPPEDTRWDLLGDLTSHIDLTHVYEAVVRKEAIQFAWVIESKGKKKKKKSVTIDRT